ncbi:MAG: right-handed parallel beta-helix repeat-containing protein [Acidimicrobiales bacterium]
MMRRLMVLVMAAGAAVVAVVMLAGSSASALTSYVVTTDADSGPGSLRAALDLADSDGDDSIITFGPAVDAVTALSQLTYAPDESPSYDLTILGGGVTIDRPLELDTVGDVTIRNMTVDLTTPGTGIDIEIYDGPAAVVLDRVTVTGATGEGVFIGQDDGAQPLTVSILYSAFTGNGSDGVEVYADQNGSVDVTVRSSTFVGNGTFGLEVAQENDPGGAISEVTILDSSFTGNGEDGAHLYNYWSTLDVDITGSHFDSNGTGGEGDGLLARNESGGVTLAVSGSTFDGNSDDGLRLGVGDVDESRDTSITVRSSQMVGNDDEGAEIDFEGWDGEEFTLSFTDVRVADNGETGLEVDVDDEIGAATVTLTRVEVIGNNASGSEDGGVDIDFDETDGATTSVSVRQSTFLGNGEDGLSINQDYDDITVDVSTSVFRNNGDDGLEVENDEDDIYLTVTASQFANNGDDGLYIDNDYRDTMATLTASQFSGNGDDGADLYSEYDGSFDVSVRLSKFEDNGEDGLDVESYGDDGCGDVDMRVVFSQATGNVESGFQLDACDEASGFFLVVTATGNGGPGVEIEGSSGLVWLLFSDLLGNSGGKFTADPGVTVLAIGS